MPVGTSVYEILWSIRKRSWSFVCVLRHCSCTSHHACRGKGHRITRVEETSVTVVWRLLLRVMLRVVRAPWRWLRFTLRRTNPTGSYPATWARSYHVETRDLLALEYLDHHVGIDYPSVVWDGLCGQPLAHHCQHYNCSTNIYIGWRSSFDPSRPIDLACQFFLCKEFVDGCPSSSKNAVNRHLRYHSSSSQLFVASLTPNSTLSRRLLRSRTR